MEHAFALTQGQPWLVNALAREVVEKLRPPLEEPISIEHLERAKERLILARQTHLDSLVARLMEPRVRKIVEPLLAGSTLGGESYDDDLAYVWDLGLAALDAPVRIANPVYREVIARVLAAGAQDQVDLEPKSLVTPDGTLDLRRVLTEFASFWREHGEVIAGKMPYHEVAPQPKSPLGLALPPLALQGSGDGGAGPAAPTLEHLTRRERGSWAALLCRKYDVDALPCPRRDGRSACSPASPNIAVFRLARSRPRPTYVRSLQRTARHHPPGVSVGDTRHVRPHTREPRRADWPPARGQPPR